MNIADEDLPTVEQITERRKDLELSQLDLAKRLAEQPGYDLAASTLSGRISSWQSEDDDAVATLEDRRALTRVIYEIVAERNFTHPTCSNPECGRTPINPPDIIDGEPYCIVCGYARGVTAGVSSGK